MFLGEVEDDARRLGNADALRGYGRLPDEDLQLVDVLTLTGAHV